MLSQKTDNEEGNGIAQQPAETRLSVGPFFHAAYLSRLLNCANAQISHFRNSESLLSPSVHHLALLETVSRCLTVITITVLCI